MFSPLWEQIAMASAVLYSGLIFYLNLGSYSHRTLPFPGIDVDSRRGRMAQRNKHSAERQRSADIEKRHSPFSMSSSGNRSGIPSRSRVSRFATSPTCRLTETSDPPLEIKSKSNVMPNPISQHPLQDPYCSPNRNACQSIQFTAGVGQSLLLL